MFQNATLASALARCLNCWSLAMSPIAQTPSTFVAIVSSITIRPRSREFDAAGGRVEQVGVRFAAGGHEQFVDHGHRPRRTRSRCRRQSGGPRSGRVRDGGRRGWRTRSVKRSAMSWSKPRSILADRANSVTSEPSPAKTCPISAAMNPPPMIPSRGGSESRRMIESDVWNPVSTRPLIGGTIGRGPAAISTCGAVIDAAVDVEHLVADEPRRALDQRQVRRARRPILAPPAEIGSIRPKMRSRIIAQSAPLNCVSIPSFADVSAPTPPRRPGARTSWRGCTRG